MATDPEFVVVVNVTVEKTPVVVENATPSHSLAELVDELEIRPPTPPKHNEGDEYFTDDDERDERDAVLYRRQCEDNDDESVQPDDLYQ